MLVAALPIFIIASFLMDPFSGFAGKSEFRELSGRSAKHRLSDWPEGVDPAAVQKVSYKCEYARDSYSAWYRVQLAADAATKWMDHMHKRQEDRSKTLLHQRHEGLEGVHRTILGPPPQHWQTGETPSWWTPPGIDFRATEIMLWYTDYNSGVGRATYSGFDKSNEVLWLYDYASQHDILWSRGGIPGGDTFTTIAD